MTTDPATVVHATPSGVRYHDVGCETLDEARAGNRVRALTLTEAQTEQLRPCGVCLPVEAAQHGPAIPETLDLTKAARIVVAKKRRYEGVSARGALAAAEGLDTAIGMFEALTGLDTKDAIEYAEELAAREEPHRHARYSLIPF